VPPEDPENPAPPPGNQNPGPVIPVAPPLPGAVPQIPTVESIARSVIQELIRVGPQHPMFDMIAQATRQNQNNAHQPLPPGQEANSQNPLGALPPEHGDRLAGSAGFNVNANNEHGFNFRPLLRTTDIVMPTYAGASDRKTPFDFLEELQKYQAATAFPDEGILNHVLRHALKGTAYRWFEFHNGFPDMATFKEAFRKEYQAIGYSIELKKELETRTQGVDEPLTTFIYAINAYYQRLNPETPQVERVRRAMDNMHPEYKWALGPKEFDTLQQLVDAAHEAQALLKRFRSYHPPPTADRSLEPSLA